MSYRVTFEDAFMLLYCSDKYKTHKISYEVVDDCLEAYFIVMRLVFLV